jgi:6-phosphogluconolactonase
MSTYRGLRIALALGLAGAGVAALATPASASANGVGAVYVQTNAPAGNEVLVLDRYADGSLHEAGRVATHGLGSGAGLGSQGAVTLSQDGRHLLAVNAGSDDVSAFRVGPNGLALVDTAPSGGDRPISVTIYGSLVYVVNADGSANVSGFRLGRDGLVPLPGSTRALSATAPGQVSFTPDGRRLVVTGKGSSTIDTFAIDSDGRALAPVSSGSAGATPFGFDFDNKGHVVVSEAAGGAPDASSASSYDLGVDGTLAPVSGAIPTHQTAACWLVVSKNGRFAYTTNAGSGSVSSYAIAPSGALTLLQSVAAAPGGGPTDEAFSGNGRFLYVLNPRLGAVNGYRVAPDGSLAPLAGAAGLPTGLVGLAAR